MAPLHLARRSTGLLLPAVPSLLRLRPSPPSSSLPPPLILKPTIPNPVFFFSHSQDSSDSEPDFHEPTKLCSNSNLPTLLQLVSDSKSQSSTQEAALARLKSSSLIEVSKDLVFLALWELRRDWESAVLVFKWAGDCVWDCPKALLQMLWVLGKEGRFDLAWSLIRRMYKKSVLTKDAMVVMMERYAAANEASKAIQTFHAMEKFKIDADSTAFYALIRALCKNRNIEEAEELLLQNRKYFPLETEGFNMILDGWCNVITDVVQAKRVWREMSNCCINPDATSYTHMICCFSKVGNLFDSLRLYDEMKKRGWTPDLVVYNSLIYVLTRENCIKEACNIFNKVTEVGMKPDVRTYNSMICPLCERYNLNEAREMMDDMIQKDIVPNCDTYHAFAKVEDMEGTLKLLRNMRDIGCGPNRYTFLIIIDKFLKINECESALRIWSEMKRYDVIPDFSHYMALIEGLTMHGWIPKAMELYNEMKCRRFPGDPKVEKIFNSFLSSNKNHWGRGGKEYIISRCGQKHHLKGVKIH